MATALIQRFRIDPADLPDEAVIFGCTAAMRENRDKIDRNLSNDLPVLIQGESGTGKEVVARFLHTHSDRRDGPFVKLNCAAIPAEQAEIELFGYVKRSSSGVLETQTGLVDIANGGTLFLEEIEDMDWELQSKLLYFLQDGVYRRAGGREERRVRARVVCATNVDLERAVQAGAFHEDLFRSISAVSLRLPALRERKEDILQLSGHFLEKLSRQFRRSAPQLSAATLRLFTQWGWPGNLRELENWIARAVILGDDKAIGAELERIVNPAGESTGRRPSIGSLTEVSRPPTSTAANLLILRVLEANRWNRRRTAEELNISYRSLLNRLREAGLPQRRRAHRGPTFAN